MNSLLDDVPAETLGTDFFWGRVMRFSISYRLYFWLLASAVLAALLFFLAVIIWPKMGSNIVERIIKAWAEDSDYIFKLIGAAVTVFTGVAGLYRLWHFGNRQLPKRLADYIDRCNEASIDLRADLLSDLDRKWVPSLVPTETASRRQREKYRERLSSHFADLKFQSLDARRADQLLNERLGLLRQATAQRSYDKASVHLVRGLDFARCADAGQQVEVARRSAIDQLHFSVKFDALVDAKRRDARIHRAYVEQLEKGESTDDARRAAIEGWIEATAVTGSGRENGTALAKLGRFIFEKSKDPSLTQVARIARLREARDSLDAAVTLLQDNPAQGVAIDADPLFAGTLECLGDVRVELGNRPTACARYIEALSIWRVRLDIPAIQRTSAKLEAVSGQSIEAGPSSPESSVAAVVRALKQLAIAQALNGQNLDAQSTFLSAQARFRGLNVPNDLSEAAHAELGLELDITLQQV